MEHLGSEVGATPLSTGQLEFINAGLDHYPYLGYPSALALFVDDAAYLTWRPMTYENLHYGGHS